MTKPILEVKNVKKYFPIKKGFFQNVKGHLRAVDGVSLSIKKGETFGLVGESGCGKSTLVRVILSLMEPTDGKVIFENTDVTKLNNSEKRALRKEFQIIF